MDGGIWKPIVAFVAALAVAIKFYELTSSTIPYPLAFSFMLAVAIFATVIRLVQFL
jgi:hypothetical protein